MRLLVVAVLTATACHTGQGAAPADAAPRPVDAAVDAAPLPPQTARLRVVNRCAETLWIAHSDNLAGDQDVALAPGALHDYTIPDGGLASVRLWPKLGCDATGHACTVGDNGEGGGAPCGPSGCEPPFDSKFEATFAATGAADQSWYDLSLVDGFTLPLSVTPIGDGAGGGTCTVSDCAQLTQAACPAHDSFGDPAYADVDLRSGDDACLSPCKRWNYPAPYGFGEPETQDPGLHMCCPTPPMTPDACRDATDPLSVVHTQYVAAVHALCPTAYSYAYDDAAGLHACPSDTKFAVVFCP